MDFRAFPFDKQFCKINLYVGGYSKRDGTFNIRTSEMVFTEVSSVFDTCFNVRINSDFRFTVKHTVKHF